MADNQTIKERLLLYLNNKGVSPFAFEKACGLSQGFVKNIRVNIAPDKLAKITNTYDDLNAAWLLTGEGLMLKIDATGPRPEIVADSEELTALRNEVERLKRVNETQAQTIRDQAAVLKALTAHSTTHQENEVPLLSMPKPEYNKL